MKMKKLVCKIIGHKYYIYAKPIEPWGEGIRWLKCRRCGSDFVINDVKVTFFTSDAVNIDFQVIKYSFNYKNINIATIDCVTALKFSAIAQRNTIRDYYDLYFIAKHESDLNSMINKTKVLLPHLSPITYTETLAYIDDIDEMDLSSHLRPKENITKSEIRDYFVAELKKLF